MTRLWLVLVAACASEPFPLHVTVENHSHASLAFVRDQTTWPIDGDPAMQDFSFASYREAHADPPYVTATTNLGQWELTAEVFCGASDPDEATVLVTIEDPPSEGSVVGHCMRGGEVVCDYTYTSTACPL